MTNSLLRLGPHSFEIAPLNFQELSRETEVKWPAIPRFGGKPTRQMTGEGENDLTISGLLYPDDFGGRAELEALRATQLARKPVIMAGWAAGTSVVVWGKVAILKIHDKQTYINERGQGRKVSFKIDIAPLPKLGEAGGFWI